MGRPFDDIAGQRFGRWTALDRAEDRIRSGQRYPHWRCRCDCGTERVVDKASLVSGNSQSCGCARKDRFDVALEHETWRIPDRSKGYFGKGRTDHNRLTPEGRPSDLHGDVLVTLARVRALEPETLPKF